MLRSFQLYPVRHERERKCERVSRPDAKADVEAHVNPEEIVLHSSSSSDDDDDDDDDDGNDGDAANTPVLASAWSTFADFGLGPLAAVPRVRCLFQTTGHEGESGLPPAADALTSADVARQLATFMDEREGGGGGTGDRGVDFARFLCESYGVATTCALGVRVHPGPLAVERLMARHVAAAANREAERAAAANQAAVAAAVAAAAAAALAALPPRPPRLHPPRGAAARDFLAGYSTRALDSKSYTLIAMPILYTLNR